MHTRGFSYLNLFFCVGPLFYLIFNRHQTIQSRRMDHQSEDSIQIIQTGRQMTAISQLYLCMLHQRCSTKQRLVTNRGKLLLQVNAICAQAEGTVKPVIITNVVFIHSDSALVRFHIIITVLQDCMKPGVSWSSHYSWLLQVSAQYYIVVHFTLHEQTYLICMYIYSLMWAQYQVTKDKCGARWWRGSGCFCSD